jgi:deoxyxylulose-5-phosphate synthase
LRQDPRDGAVIVSSGRGVHEALSAAAQCANEGVSVGVVDMPSIDEELLMELFDSGKLLVFAEQNNGYIWQNFLKILYRHRAGIGDGRLDRVVTVNTLNAEARPLFIHSGTYEELLEAFALSAPRLARMVMDRVDVGVVK